MGNNAMTNMPHTSWRLISGETLARSDQPDRKLAEAKVADHVVVVEALAAAFRICRITDKSVECAGVAPGDVIMVDETPERIAARILFSRGSVLFHLMASDYH
jgi:hypothetical protein